MEYVRNIFKILKPKKGKNSEEKSVNNPVTTQNSSNTSNPQFITHVHHYHDGRGVPGVEGTSSIGPALVTTSYDDFTEPQQSLSFGSTSSSDQVEWILAKPGTVDALADRAVIGGYDYDGSPLWVIRTRLGGELLPGKLNIISRGAYAAWHLDEVTVGVFEVCCIPTHKIKWVDAQNGIVPTNAIEGGKTSGGEKLYIGRATYDRSLIPGKIQPSRGCCYVTYAFKAHEYKNYEVLCSV